MERVQEGLRRSLAGGQSSSAPRWVQVQRLCTEVGAGAWCHVKASLPALGPFPAVGGGLGPA